MCGLAGVYARTGLSREDVSAAGTMSDRLAHRGPDGSGTWRSADDKAIFVFRRLRIIDLSAAGDQPMVSKSGRFTIAYNGEVYNFEELRAELRGRVDFVGHSDTEVVLEAIDAWGLERALSRMIGMFAFALWDRDHARLSLVRDRFGVKPLYYAAVANGVVFGSELRAVASHPRVKLEISPAAVDNFLTFGFIPGNGSIYSSISRVPPGTLVTIDATTLTSHAYWDFDQRIDASRQSQFRGTFDAAVDELESLIRDSVRLRMISDVPLGVFLSGGVDSSIVAAVMSRATSQRVKTFTVRFEEPDYDESGYASAVANILGTEHHELPVSALELSDTMRSIGSLADEPLADASLIPMYLLSKKARQHVTVCLSGDGGDELFGGYSRHIWADRLNRIRGRLPQMMRRRLGRLLALSNNATVDKMISRIRRVVSPALSMPFSRQGSSKLSRFLSCDRDEALYASLVASSSARVSIHGEGAMPVPDALSTTASLADSFMYNDSVEYLPNDVLMKVDRASMAVSLEAREPLLDHRIAEFAWSLPLDFKIQGLSGKRVLRTLLRRYLPARLVDRPKAGFDVPLAPWLRTYLRDWAEEWLDETRLRSAGLVDAGTVRRKWAEHMSGRANQQEMLWAVIVLHAWLEQQRALSANERLATCEPITT